MPVDTRFEHLFEPIAMFVKIIIKAAAKTLVMIPRAIMAVQAFVWASMSLGVMLAFVFLVGLLMYYMHPRPALPNRYVQMESFLVKYTSDITRTVDVIVRGGVPGALQGVPGVSEAADQMRGICMQLLTYPPSFAEALDAYLRFRESIKSMSKGLMYKAFARMSLRNTAIFAGSNGDLDRGKVKHFDRNFINNMDRLGPAVSGLLQALEAGYTAYGDKQDSIAYKYKSAVVELDILLNQYMPRALPLMSTRVPQNSSLNFTILQRYYVPLVNDLIQNGFINGVVESAKVFTKTWVFLDLAWGEVGAFIARLPCVIAPDHQDKCGEVTLNVSFGGQEYFMQQPESAMEPTANNDVMSSYNVAEAQVHAATGGIERAEVREGFGSVLRLASNIGSFFNNFRAVGNQFVSYGKTFTKDPLKAIMGLIQLLLAPIVFFVILMVYFLLTVPIPVSIVWIVITINSLIISNIYFRVTWFLRIVYAIALFIVFFVLWAIDMVTGGLVLKLLQCEDDVDAQEFRSDHALGNGFTRGLTGCMCPCLPGYTPKNFGFLGNSQIMCQRRNPSQPRLCPQQHLLRLLRGRGSLGVSPIFTFRPGPLFGNLSAPQKYQKVREAFRDRGNYLGACSRDYPQLKAATRHVCRNIKYYLPTGSKDAETLCAQMFCIAGSEPADWKLCDDIKEEKARAAGGDNWSNVGEDPSNIMRRTAIVAVVAIVGVIAVLALIKAGVERLKPKKPT